MYCHAPPDITSAQQPVMPHSHEKGLSQGAKQGPAGLFSSIPDHPLSCLFPVRTTLGTTEAREGESISFSKFCAVSPRLWVKSNFFTLQVFYLQVQLKWMNEGANILWSTKKTFFPFLVFHIQHWFKGQNTLCVVKHQRSLMITVFSTRDFNKYIIIIIPNLLDF